MSLKGNACIGQSGGPTIVINASMVGAVETARDIPEIEEFYGAVHGLSGLLNEELTELFRVSPEVMAALKYCPSAAIGTARLKPKEPDLERTMEVFRAHNIRYFFYNGGNDTQLACHLISELAKQSDWEMKVIGIPKTIDNDLAITDHCPGYASAARYVAAAVQFAGKDSEAFGTPHVIECMGRDVGWLTAAAAAGQREEMDPPHLLYLPEKPVTRAQFLADCREAYAKYGFLVVAVSEGFAFEGEDKAKTSDKMDDFGHARLGGVGKALSDLLEKEGVASRSRDDKLGNLQRCFAWAASKVDLDEAYEVGRQAVLKAVKGETDIMLTIDRKSDDPYVAEIGDTALMSVAGVEKGVPPEFINETGNGVTEGFMRYIAPLVAEAAQPIAHELPHWPRLPYFMVDKKLKPYEAKR
ncbi:MAG: 6-phosphofructokinase [Candidatus Zipacnadales bacterium]